VTQLCDCDPSSSFMLTGCVLRLVHVYCVAAGMVTSHWRRSRARCAARSLCIELRAWPCAVQLQRCLRSLQSYDVPASLLQQAEFQLHGALNCYKCCCIARCAAMESAAPAAWPRSKRHRLMQHFKSHTLPDAVCPTRARECSTHAILWTATGY